MGKFLKKNHFWRCWGRLSLLNWIGGSYFISVAKTASKKIGPLIHFVKFIPLYLYKYTIHPCMKCCHIWAGAFSCYLELLDKLQKWICKTVGPSLAPSLKLLAHHQNVATISFIIFWDFWMFSQIFLSPQVKWWAIIAYKHGIYKLPHKLPNDLRLRILGNQEIKCLNFIKW